MAVKTVKCVVVGDGMVGKTCLLMSYTSDTFPVDYVPTVFDNFAEDIVVDGLPVNFQLWDTAGQEDYDRIRSLAYPDTDVFMLCFSLMSETSLKNAKEKWYPEIRSHDAHVPIVLVGTKMDLRQDKAALKELRDKKKSPITTSQGNDIARAIKAKVYFECSALTKENLKNAFKETARIGLNKGSAGKTNSGSKCVIL